MQTPCLSSITSGDGTPWHAVVACKRHKNSSVLPLQVCPPLRLALNTNTHTPRHAANDMHAPVTTPMLLHPLPPPLPACPIRLLRWTRSRSRSWCACSCRAASPSAPPGTATRRPAGSRPWTPWPQRGAAAAAAAQQPCPCRGRRTSGGAVRLREGLWAAGVQGMVLMCRTVWRGCVGVGL